MKNKQAKLTELMRESEEFKLKGLTTYQLKGHIVVSMKSESEFYDEKTGELLKDWSDTMFRQDYTNTYQEITQREFISFMDPVVYVVYNETNDSASSIAMMSNDEVPELIFKTARSKGVKSTVLCRNIAGMISRAEIENMLSKVEENGVLFADVVSIIKGRLISDAEHADFIKDRIVDNDISANSSGSVRLFKKKDSEYPISSSSNEDDIFVFTTMPKVEFRNVITDRAELIRYINSRLPKIYHKFVEKVFNTVVTKDVTNWQNAAKLNDKFSDVCRSWVETTKAPKCEYDPQYTAFIPMAYTEFNDPEIQRGYEAFKDYWYNVNDYIDIKEFAESIITANETKLINRCLECTRVAMLDVLVGQNVTCGYRSNANFSSYINYLGGSKPGSWYIEDTIRKAYFWTIPTKIDYNYPVNMSNVVKNIDVCNSYTVNVLSESEEEFTSVHTQNIDSDTLAPIVHAFTVLDVNAMRSYIPKIENLIKILSAKYDRHVARTMDFSSCTIDNVTNYVEERKIRIDYLDSLITSFKLVIDIINSIQGDEISILDLYEKMVHEFTAGPYGWDYGIHLFIWANVVQTFDSCFSIINAIDEFHPEIEEIDKKFNIILKTITAMTPALVKTSVEDGKKIVRSLQTFNLTFKAIAISDSTNK